MAVTPFVESRLPEDVERGARGGPGFKTTVIPLDSGHEWRNSTWAEARARWDIGYGITSKKNLDKVINFFYARRGRLVGFRFKDWTDYEVNQVLTAGDASDVKSTFSTFKRYDAGDGFYYDRPIRKLVDNTYTVFKNGAPLTEGVGASQYQIDIDTGIITLGTDLVEGDQLRIVSEFDVPVRFDTDELNIDAETWEAGSIPSIPVIELKLKP